MVYKNRYLLKTISCQNFFNWKTLVKKGGPHKYKKYRNILSTILKKSKQFYFTRFFQENIKDLKIFGEEERMSSNNSNYIFPTTTTVNKEAITNPSYNDNAFNNYLAKVAIDIQSYIRFSKKKYYDYLPPLNIESFFITLTDSTDVSNIISSLNKDKIDGPNSIPIKILKLFNKDLSDQLAILFNQSLSSWIFPSIWKPITLFQYKEKVLYWNLQTVDQFFLLSNIDKFLERLMYNRLYNFLAKKETIFHSSLIFVRNALPLMLWFISQIKWDMRLVKVTMLLESL